MKQIISHLPQYAVGYVAVIVSFLAAFGWLGLSTSAFLFWPACAFLLWTGYELLVRGLCRLPVRIGGAAVPVISPEERLARERVARKEFARRQQEQTVRRIDTVADYARDTMAAYMREEHLPLLQAQVRRFATGGDLEALPLETVGLDMTDIHHLCWNIGHALLKSGTETAAFAKATFSLTFKGCSVETIRKKLHVEPRQGIIKIEKEI